MLGISRRLDNEHGYRIDSITKPYLNRKYHPNRGYRHVTMSRPKHGTQVGTHKWHYQVPYHTNLFSPPSGRNTKTCPSHPQSGRQTYGPPPRPSHPLSEDGQTNKKKKKSESTIQQRDNSPHHWIRPPATLNKTQSSGIEARPHLTST